MPLQPLAKAAAAVKQAEVLPAAAQGVGAARFLGPKATALLNVVRAFGLESGLLGPGAAEHREIN